MGSDRLQQWLLRAGLIISGVLLIRFAIDFSDGMHWWLAAPLWLLVIATVGVGIANLLGAPKPETARDSRSRSRALLLAAIPLAFLASSLDCIGLSMRGGSPFCTFVKLAWIPLIVGFCAFYFFKGNPRWRTGIAAMSFVSLVPHCVCYNVGNAWWIDHLGASPVCYVWGFVVSIVALSALRKGANLWLTQILCFTIIAGATAFFVSHHYFQFPW